MLTVTKTSKIIMLISLLLAVAILLTGILVVFLGRLYIGSVPSLAIGMLYRQKNNDEAMWSFTPATSGRYRFVIESTSTGIAYLMDENSKSAFQEGEYLMYMSIPTSSSTVLECYISAGVTRYLYISTYFDANTTVLVEHK